MKGKPHIWILNGISLMLTSGALAGYVLNNLAQNKRAVQSSEGDSVPTADRAVDGNRDPFYSRLSCSVTKRQSDPWWRVDLQRVCKIQAVTITSRYDEEYILNGAEIWIGNLDDFNDNKKIRCGAISNLTNGRTVYFPCNPTEGRYVTVSLPGSNKALSLCEVEVFHKDHVYPLSNVALKGEATQSSVLSFATASKAIDGKRNSFYGKGFCSHTAEDETNPWWKVDLQETYSVTYIKITNRGDCCAERLDGAEIRVGNSKENNGMDNPRCATISHINAGKTYTYYCDGGMLGRFVTIFIPGEKKTLTLCEVEVYASPTVTPLPNVALKKPATQSTTQSSGLASNAVSGCRDPIFPNGCCTHTTAQTNPWWRVDLSAQHKVHAITIINRQDCCASRIVGAQIRIGNSSDINSTPSCGTISQEMRMVTYHCTEVIGRFIFVSVAGSDKTLSLCEVDVYASPYVVVPSPSPLPAPPVLPPPPPPSANLSLSNRKVTLVGKKLCWSDALFYCRRNHWDLLSIHSLEEQTEVQQLLSSSSFPLTDHVWLGLRRYLSDDTWFWMTGDYINFNQWTRGLAPDSNSHLCGGMNNGASHQHQWDDERCEEPFNFICQTRVEDGPPRVYFYSTRQPPQLSEG